MTHPAWNMKWRTAGEPARSTNRGMPLLTLRAKSLHGGLVYLFLLLSLLGFPARMQGADEPSGPFLFVSSTRTPKDIEIEARVRRVLRQDAQLRPLNLAVHVRGGVASLSGPVPTAELKQKAVTIAQHVEGVLTVSAKDLYLSTSEQGGKRLSVLIPDDRPTQTRSASPGSPSPEGGWRIEDEGTRQRTTQSQQITLLAPEMPAPAVSPLPPPHLREERRGGARLTAHPHPASPAVSLSAAIEHLRRRETRYQQIRIQVQGTTVYVFPGGTTSEDAMTFAQAVRRLPGVQHVIMAADPR